MVDVFPPIVHPGEAPALGEFMLHEDLGTLGAYPDKNKVDASDLNAWTTRIRSLCEAQRALSILVGKAPDTEGLAIGQAFRYTLAAVSGVQKVETGFADVLQRQFISAVASLHSDLTRTAVPSSSFFFGAPFCGLTLASGFSVGQFLGFSSDGTLVTYQGGVHPCVGRVVATNYALIDVGGRFRLGTGLSFTASGAAVLKPSQSLNTLTVGQLTVVTAGHVLGTLTISDVLTALSAIQAATHYRIGVQQVVSAAMHQAYSDIVGRFRINAADGTPRAEFLHNALVGFAAIATKNAAATLTDRILVRSGVTATETAIGGVTRVGNMLAMYGNLNLQSAGAYRIADVDRIDASGNGRFVGLSASGHPIFKPACGELYFTGTGISQSIGTAFVTINQWYASEFSGVSGNLSKKYLDVLAADTYYVTTGISFSGTANTTFEIRLFVNGVACAKCGAIRKLGAAGDVGEFTLPPVKRSGIGAHAKFDMRVKADGAAKIFKIQAGNFQVRRRGG